jgi:hypothetical protein
VQKSFHIWRAASRAALSPEYTYRSRSRWAERSFAAARISASVRGNVPLHKAKRLLYAATRRNRDKPESQCFGCAGRG